MARLTVRDRTTGRVKVDASTPTLLFLGVKTIGGEGSPQSGTVVDDRFRWGTPFIFVTHSSFTGRDGLEASITFNDNVMTWAYPRGGSSASERPAMNFIYAVQP